ncbi:hypothetical protein ACIBQX_50505 [Nonomuraea sp. NPDC049714]|uniref:hypothetical protein n=1 Tax=Nonomuraea sp. NPDC049714 TaxID=3364357 RepID=UPI0037A14136
MRRPFRVELHGAIVLVVLGAVATAVCLDAPSDRSVVRLGWRPDGVVVDVPAPAGSSGLRTGDLVTGVAGRPLGDGPGAVDRPLARSGAVAAPVGRRGGRGQPDHGGRRTQGRG